MLLEEGEPPYNKEVPPVFAIKQFLNVSTDADVADELGALRAQAKVIADQAKFLEGLLKEKRVAVAEGKKYRVTISYDIETERVAWKNVAEQLGASAELIEANSSVSKSDRVLVTAHKKRA